MKKSKKFFVIFLILYIILCFIGAFVYFDYIDTSTVYNFNIGSSDIKINFSCPENFHANYSTDDDSKSCIFTGLYDNPLMSLSIENCEYNLEGYTLEQYVDNLEASDAFSFKMVGQEYLDNSHNYAILKTEYAEQDKQIVNFINYTILYNNVFYQFKTYSQSEEMYEKYKSSIDSIMKNIQIDDSNFSFNYKLDTTAKNYVPYYYSLLSNEDKKIYNDILKVFNTYETIKDGVEYTTKFSKTVAEYENILSAIARDNVEYSNMFFYNFDYNEAKNEFRAYLDYDDTSNKIRDYKGLMDNINSVADKIINNMPSNLTLYGKYKYLAKSMCNLVEYDSANENTVYGIHDVFLNGKAKCAGYACAYQYLCNRAGLFCTQISGTPKGSIGHIWNVIKLNNEYYYMDTTWMDSGNDLDVFNYDGCKDEEHIKYLNNLDLDIYKVFTNTGKVNWKEVKELL